MHAPGPPTQAKIEIQFRAEDKLRWLAFAESQLMSLVVHAGVLVLLFFLIGGKNKFGTGEKTIIEFDFTEVSSPPQPIAVAQEPSVKMDKPVEQILPTTPMETPPPPTLTKDQPIEAPQIIQKIVVNKPVKKLSREEVAELEREKQQLELEKKYNFSAHPNYNGTGDASENGDGTLGLVDGMGSCARRGTMCMTLTQAGQSGFSSYDFAAASFSGSDIIIKAQAFASSGCDRAAQAGASGLPEIHGDPNSMHPPELFLMTPVEILDWKNCGENDPNKICNRLKGTSFNCFVEANYRIDFPGKSIKLARNQGWDVFISQIAASLGISLEELNRIAMK